MKFILSIFSGILILSNSFSLNKLPTNLNIHEKNQPYNSHNKKTKQIITIGPSCSSIEELKLCHELGVNVFRINLSHSSHTEAKSLVRKLNRIKQNSDTDLEILMDLQGPKYRIGKLLYGITGNFNT